MRHIWICLALLVSSRSSLEAQWRDPKLIAGQVAFGVGVTFFGKLLLEDEPAGRAFKKALAEGAAAGALAHAGYSISGTRPHWALAGKALVQKSGLMVQRSLSGEPVFDASLYSSWRLTHSFLHFEWNGKPRVEIDAVNSAVAAYFLLSDRYEFDPARSLYSGSLFFQNRRPPPGVRGAYAPGVIWMHPEAYEDRATFGHELVHGLQAERGAAIHEWRFRAFRFNWLVLGSALPAALGGWPEHDRRLHEIEANRYAPRH